MRRYDYFTCFLRDLLTVLAGVKYRIIDLAHLQGELMVDVFEVFIGSSNSMLTVILNIVKYGSMFSEQNVSLT